MNKELLEKGVDMQNSPEQNNYQQYLELGGIINENNYYDALIRSRETTTLDKALIKQAENIAKFAGIELHSTQDTIDPRIILYGLLRDDVQLNQAKYHPIQIDQCAFVEALRMFGDIESVNKMIKAYPNISFKYQRGNSK